MSAIELELAESGVRATAKALTKFWRSLTAAPNLDAAFTQVVLAELPRLFQLIERRAQEVLASGCTLAEAQILVIQTIDAQRRSFDPEKRARLAQVMANGFGLDDWSRVRHALLIRFAFELEPEHVEILRAKAAKTSLPAWVPADLRKVLENELLARGLLDLEFPAPSTEPVHSIDAFTGHGHFAQISTLGRAFLDSVTRADPIESARPSDVSEDL